MAKVFVKYNPYRLSTEIVIDGNPISADSEIYAAIAGKRLQEWIGNFPKMLLDDTNCEKFEIEFYGSDLDWDDFREAFAQAELNENTNSIDASVKHVNTPKSDENIQRGIVKVFNDLSDPKAPIPDFRSPELVRHFESVKNAVFPIQVIATMSSGKSTVINSLLQKCLMPYKNEACTALITEILDNDESFFSAKVIENGNRSEPIETIDVLTGAIMSELNQRYGNDMRIHDDDSSEKPIYTICANGNIPFINANDIALKLIDTPGPDSAANKHHKEVTEWALRENNNNLIMYVLDGTKLDTVADESLLTSIADCMKNGGKLARDRFMFVLNKMDVYAPDKEDIPGVISNAKKYLAKFGIIDPQIFPCSALVALMLRTELSGKLVGLKRARNLDDDIVDMLSSDAQSAIPSVDKLNRFEDLHLEKYSTVSPSEQAKIRTELNKAIEEGDIEKQALIHSGIISIEAAVTAYVKKYARTKKIKDLVDTFEGVLESSGVLSKAAQAVIENKKFAEECLERQKRINEKISEGKEADEFKTRVSKLDPMPTIREKADEERKKVLSQLSAIFPSDEVITSESYAKSIVKHFSQLAEDRTTAMNVQLEVMIRQEIVENGTQLLQEYQKKLTAIDEQVTTSELDFSTVDLIKGALSGVTSTVQKWGTESFATDTLSEVGTYTEETKEYYEKVGEETVLVKTGKKEKVQTGTKRVKVGSHKEVTGSHKEKNPRRKGFWGFFRFSEPWEIDVDEYTTVDDYEEQAIFTERDIMREEKRDVMEKRTERIKKFRIETAELYQHCVTPLTIALDDGMKMLISHAEKQVADMKSQFMSMFGELDNLIKSKYDELNSCITDAENAKKKLVEAQTISQWISDNKSEIDALLDI